MALFIGSVMLGMKRVGPAHVARLPLTTRRERMKAAAVAINDDWPKGLHEVFGLFISSEPLDCRTGEELFPGLYEAVVRRRSREGFHAIVNGLGLLRDTSHPGAYGTGTGTKRVNVAIWTKVVDN